MRRRRMIIMPWIGLLAVVALMSLGVAGRRYATRTVSAQPAAPDHSSNVDVENPVQFLNYRAVMLNDTYFDGEDPLPSDDDQCVIALVQSLSGDCFSPVPVTYSAAHKSFTASRGAFVLSGGRLTGYGVKRDLH